MNRGLIKLIAFLLLIVILTEAFIPIIEPALKLMLPYGSYDNFYLSLVGKYPFKKETSKCIVQIMKEVFKVGINLDQYLLDQDNTSSKLEIIRDFLNLCMNIPFYKVGTDGIDREIYQVELEIHLMALEEYLLDQDVMSSMLELIRDFLKLCMNAIFYGALSGYGESVMGISKNSKGYLYLLKAIWNMVAFVVSTILINWVMGFAFEQIEILGGIAGYQITYIISLLVMTNGAFFVALTLGVSAGITILYFFVKYIFANVASLVVSEIVLGMFLISLSEGLYVYAAGYGGLFVACVVVMSLVGAAIDGIVAKSKKKA